MGLTRCSKHGDQGTAGVCTHLKSAIVNDVQKLYHDIEKHPELYLNLMLCNECKMQSDQAHSDDELEQLMGNITIHCNPCVTEWIARFG